jgi:hypothetical protein
LSLVPGRSFAAGHQLMRELLEYRELELRVAGQRGTEKRGWQLDPAKPPAAPPASEQRGRPRVTG